VSDGELSVAGEGEANHAGASRSRAYQWGELMRRTFCVDELACPSCGGRLRHVAVMEQPSLVQRILRHPGLPTGAPETRLMPSFWMYLNATPPGEAHGA
jgi:hypothetical protein